MLGKRALLTTSNTLFPLEDEPTETSPPNDDETPTKTSLAEDDILTATPTSNDDVPTEESTLGGGELEPAQGGCSVVEDCMPAIICTGGTVNVCEDGMCKCNLSSMGDPICSVAADCKDILDCTQGTPACWGGQCVCESSSPAATDDPETPETPDDGNICTLYIREYYDNRAWSNTFYVEYQLDTGKEKQEPVKDSYTRKWNEEQLVPTSEAKLEHPLSVVLSTKLPPGVIESQCPSSHAAGGGVRIQKLKARCFDTQWKMYMAKFGYGDLEWDS